MLGAGVLIAPDYYLTTTEHAVGFGNSVHRFSTGETSAVDEVVEYVDSDDVALVKLATPFAPPFAHIDPDSVIGGDTPVMMAQLYMPRGGVATIQELGAKYAYGEVRGMLVDPETRQMPNLYGGPRRVMAAEFHMASSKEDTGAGMFDQKGNLVAIHIASGGARTLGSRPSTVQRLAVQFGIAE